jgi:hypothetical protein
MASREGFRPIFCRLMVSSVELEWNLLEMLPNGTALVPGVETIRFLTRPGLLLSMEDDGEAIRDETSDVNPLLESCAELCEDGCRSLGAVCM